MVCNDVDGKDRTFGPWLCFLHQGKYKKIPTLLDGVGGTLLVVQLVKALRYKPACRGFDSRWCHWSIISFTQPFRPHYGPGVDSASNRN